MLNTWTSPTSHDIKFWCAGLGNVLSFLLHFFLLLQQYALFFLWCFIFFSVRKKNTGSYLTNFARNIPNNNRKCTAVLLRKKHYLRLWSFSHHRILQLSLQQLNLKWVFPQTIIFFFFRIFRSHSTYSFALLLSVTLSPMHNYFRLCTLWLFELFFGYKNRVTRTDNRHMLTVSICLERYTLNSISQFFFFYFLFLS